MTLTLEFVNHNQVESIKQYLKEIYDFIKIEPDNIPGTITYHEDSIEIYMTDEFFEYTYQFFLDRIILSTIAAGPMEQEMEEVAKEFRHGAKEILVKPLSLE